jgi:NAD(P)-dependent dehydrogenase (short-subunit alcohol dehydrogenase family)
MAIAVVTGTSTGIGFATAVTLGRAGHTVVATMRNVNSAADLQKVIAEEKLPISVAKLDVDDDASVSDAFNKVLAEHGRIDILVNNAGLGGGGSVEEAPMAAFRQIMETNFFGALRCTKAVVPHMRKQRHGCIVNVTSIAGRVALAGQGPYAASKWALEALSECLAQEMKAFNVRVTIVEPGVIATAILSKATPQPEGSPYPHRRRLIAWFKASQASPTSAYVVGEQIRQIVDGESWQLRYPVGPDALPFIRSRASKTDEEFIGMQAESDDEYKVRMKKEFGLDITL